MATAYFERAHSTRDFNRIGTGLAASATLLASGCLPGGEVVAENHETPPVTATQDSATREATPAPSPEPSVSDIPSTQPTTIETTVPVETSTPTEQVKEFEVVPLRQWNIDPALFENWESLDAADKTARAIKFFDANITDEGYDSRSHGLVTPMDNMVRRLMSELGLISDAVMDETIANGPEIASNLLDVVAADSDTGYSVKQEILDDMLATRASVVEDEYCTYLDCWLMRDDFKLDAILKTSTEPVMRVDKAGNSFEGFIATVGVKWNSTPYVPQIHTMGIDTDHSRIFFYTTDPTLTLDYDTNAAGIPISDYPEVEVYLQKNRS